MVSEGEDGVFLVRESNTSPGDYVLSVLHQASIFVYMYNLKNELPRIASKKFIQEKYLRYYFYLTISRAIPSIDYP